MIRRPFLWVAGILFTAFFMLRLFYGADLDRQYYSMDSCFEDTMEAVVYGTLDHIEQKPASYYYFLKKVSVCPKDSRQCFSFSDFLVITKKTEDKEGTSPACFSYNQVVPGNLLKISGTIYPFSSATNPGQFDEKSYYKGQNLYYKIMAADILIQDKKEYFWKKSLFKLRNALFCVYQSCMSEKNAGIVSAMLLGEKSLLDAEVKSLYQTSGIGHILAISGLHISILCAFFSWFLQFLRIPHPFPFFLTVFFILGYGAMTGFGISTSRAIIMMIFLLAGKELGRSYDALTALAFSAVLLLIQKPYAVYSGSFLLSYSAVLGSVVTYPALKNFFYGTKKEKQSDNRNQKRFLREKQANSRFPKVAAFLCLLPQKILSSFLFSCAIWITTLPVILSLFYEIPVYSIVLNLLILPFISVLVVISLIGGMVGLFYLPISRFVLTPAEWLLNSYEFLCQLFLKLPKPVLVIGMPKLAQVIFYLLILTLLLFYWNQVYEKKNNFDKILPKRFLNGFPFKKQQNPFFIFERIGSIFLFLLAGVILFYRQPLKELHITMLDVGQGDGILIQCEGKTILIDGGSSSVTNVGTYRILPCLKYHGIRKIDYMIMTHSDEDHISGQLELLQNCSKQGISIGCEIMPYLPKMPYTKNDIKLQKAAAQANIPVRLISTKDFIQVGKLTLFCLHPVKEFTSDSVNACSTVLSLSYQSFSMLFTGDLEENGEEALYHLLAEKSSGGMLAGEQDSKKNIFHLLPEKYDVLKVSHHGSKYSTKEELLAYLSPKAALISCGKKNRYGHPHKELLERLKACNSRIFRTDEGGAVQLRSDGTDFFIHSYLSEGMD